MPLTPHDVRNVAFSKPPIGKRGYNEDEVDAFLDLVGAELARLINENNDLHSRIDQLNQRLRAVPADTGRNLRPLAQPRSETAPADDRHAQTAKVLGMAQEIADRLTRDAKTEADRMLSQARTTTQQLLSEAQAKADGMVNEARSRAKTTLDDARTRAEALDRQAREQATAL
jgi:DivIVA domain-containing protein